MSRRSILARPHWAGFLHLPGLDALATPALAAADRFFGFCATRGLSDPGPRDVADWAEDAATAEAEVPALLRDLADAMAVLIPDFVERIGAAGELSSRSSGRPKTPVVGGKAPSEPKPRAAWDPVAPPERTAPVGREVSVAPWELPEAWRSDLRRMALGAPGNGVVISRSIVVRLREKLCQLAWSAREAGLDIALTPDAIDAYRADLEARGVVGRNGGIRWATLRASMEELSRYARYSGEARPVRDHLGVWLACYESRENMQPPLKFAALAKTGNTTLSVLDEADARLAQAADETDPKKRHRLRNVACILGVFPVTPLRNASASLVFGDTLHWRDESWVIDTVIVKTRTRRPEPFVMRLEPEHGRFIDAVLLGDRDPAHLPRLRKDAIDAGRPLMMLDENRPAAKSYIPRLFKEFTGNSFTTTRTMLHTDLATTLGEAGMITAMIACHQTSRQVAEKYQAQAVAIGAITRRQAAASARRSLREEDEPLNL